MPRTRIVAAIVLVLAVGVLAAVTITHRDSDHRVALRGTDRTTVATAPAASTTTRPPSTTTTTIPHDPARSFTLTQVRTIGGPISPKSVTASGTGLVFAQNMMYRHTMSVYDRDGALVKTIPDTVDLSQFGIAGHPGMSRGAPVEAAVDNDHRNMFATNYSMYGANFGPEGSDSCGGPSGLSPSYVYRVNLKKLVIDGVAQVGMVPKYVAVTPNDRYVLVTNWCSYDLSVVDHAEFREVKRISLGAYPRGIAVDRSSRGRVRRGHGLARYRPRRSRFVHRVVVPRDRNVTATPRAVGRRLPAVRHAEW